MNRYQNIQEVKDLEGTRYIQNAIYPDIPATSNDTYVITTVGDRFDTLAHQFYKDTSLWWIIATANPISSTGSLIPKPGSQLRIPANPTSIVQKYEKLNKKR